MYTEKQMEKSGAHHDAMKRFQRMIARGFAVPIVVLVILAISLWALTSMDTIANGALTFGEWARSVANHPIQWYVNQAFVACYTAAAVLFIACVGVLTLFNLIVIFTWPTR